jgi:VanZ family protein
VLLVLAYMAFVFGLSSIPGREVSRLGLSGLLVDAAHVPLFAGLAWVTLWSLQAPRALRIAAVAGACMMFALTDEWHQAFVPGRHFSVVDIGLDAAGVALGVAIGEWLGAGLDSGRGEVGG